jgi:hypothetical protein
MQEEIQLGLRIAKMNVGFFLEGLKFSALLFSQPA